ncbi:MAG: hypothetical protein ACRDGA_03935 [Bacteroidota bacterium]
MKLRESLNPGPSRQRLFAVDCGGRESVELSAFALRGFLLEEGVGACKGFGEVAAEILLAGCKKQSAGGFSGDAPPASENSYWRAG